MKVVILSKQPLRWRVKRYDEQDSNPGTALNLDWLPFLGIICRIASVNAVSEQFVIAEDKFLPSARHLPEYPAS